MDRIKKAPKAHLSICCRERDGKPACAQKNAKKLLKELKMWVKENRLKEQIKVTESSCLGFCESGIAASLQPGNLWLKNVKLEDANELKKMLQEYAE